MGVRLETAGPDHDVHGIVADVVNLYFGALQTVDVRIGVEFAHADPEAKTPKPPVHWLGFPSPASVRITPYKMRVWGVPDVILTVDAREWDVRDQDQREALMDAMLAYVALDLDRDGAVKTDDAYRPKVVLTEPDWVLAGHARVLERRGAAALEATAFRKALTDNPKLKQLVMDFAVDGDVHWHGVSANSADGCEPATVEYGKAMVTA